MDVKSAAIQVLKKAGIPLHAKDITNHIMAIVSVRLNLAINCNHLKFYA
jgi:hypothetical protein